jgi:TonB family protein
METVGPPTAEPELDLLLHWGDTYSPVRTRRAATLSVFLHITVIATVMLLPKSFYDAPPPRKAPEITRRVTPLIDPITEFTQQKKNEKKLSKEIDVASLQAQKALRTPKSAPSTTRQAAPKPAEIPTPRPPAPVALPEPPRIEATNREVPRLDLPPAPVAAPPPQIQEAEKPKLAFENVGAPPPPVDPSRRQIAVPNASVAEAIRQTARTPGGGLMVGDPGAGPGGIGEGLNLPPAPGMQGSALELKSDPQGVDFRPYLTQILATIRRNWNAVMPESVKLGRRGKVGLTFSISRVGRVDKMVYAFQSGSDPLDRAAIAAISASNPFPPLPGQFKGDRIVLQLNFAYNMPKQ